MAGRPISTMLAQGSHVQRPRRALHARRRSCRRNKQPIGKEKNPAATEIKAPPATETNSPQSNLDLASPAQNKSAIHGALESCFYLLRSSLSLITKCHGKVAARLLKAGKQETRQLFLGCATPPLSSESALATTASPFLAFPCLLFPLTCGRSRY